MKKVLLASVSRFALFEYWDQKANKNRKSDIGKEKVMATHIFTTVYMTSEIFFMRPHSTILKVFGIVSEIVFNKRKLQKIEPYGYVRTMSADDVVVGSSAKPGWCGFFAHDGDIVFWEEKFHSCIWEVSGRFVYFQKHLN